MHLLLCSDGTPASEPALRFGAALAEWLHARLTLLEAGEAGEASRGPVPSVLQTGLASGRHCRVIRRGIPRAAIMSEAQAGDYDLIVFGLITRGGWLRRSLRGPSTRRVLQAVEQPVLVVPSDRSRLNRILLCSGDLWFPEQALRLAGQIALAVGAEVTALHVVPETMLGYPFLEETEESWGALIASEFPGGSILKASLDYLRGQGVESRVSLRHGDVFAQVMEELRQGEYDLVALGSTYASQGLYHLFVRSLTDLIVEHAHRPVLVARHAGHRLPSPRASE